jgi:hypothetical protein
MDVSKCDAYERGFDGIWGGLNRTIIGLKEYYNFVRRSCIIRLNRTIIGLKVGIVAIDLIIM